MPTKGEFATIADLLHATVSRAVAGDDPDCRRAEAAGVLDRVDVLVLVLDAQGDVRAINKACADAAGQPRQDVMGTAFWPLFAAPEEQDSFRATVEMVAESGAACQFDGHLQTRGGEPRAINWSLTEIHNRTGEVQRVLLIGKPLDGDSATSTERNEAEHRASPRRGYRYRQAIAPWSGEAAPSDCEFFDVEFQDISGGGFSFFLSQRPGFEDIVVALGKSPNLTYFTAHVRHIQPSDIDGREGYLVGCQFSGRFPS